MLNGYLCGSIQQLERRAQILRAKIPRSLPRDYDTLIQTCSRLLDESLTRLRQLRTEQKYLAPECQGERIRIFRRIVCDLDILESIGIAGLDRATEDDHDLNLLIERVRREIAYPLPPPTVSTLSQQYFCIYTHLHLLCVPLSEGRFLLHLPDLYHELAHALVRVSDDPVIEPFRTALESCAELACTSLAAQQQIESRRRTGEYWAGLFARWMLCWWKYWIEEFFCDLFGACTLGPAFGWAHLHLSVKRGQDPYDWRPSSHPADDARMRAIVAALRLCGFGKEVGEIEACWAAFIDRIGAEKDPEYLRCYPEDLIEELARTAKRGIEAIGCRITGSGVPGEVEKVLNEAWQVFWQTPEAYVNWEATAVTDLRDSLRGTKGALP